MATAFRWGTLGLIRHLFESGTCTGLSDARLLERFVTHRDETAFAALVARHGSLVLNTCQAVLKDPNAADDAFQATFVLLFRKAGFDPRPGRAGGLVAPGGVSDRAPGPVRRRPPPRYRAGRRPLAGRRDPGPRRLGRGPARGDRAAPRSVPPAGRPLRSRGDDPRPGRGFICGARKDRARPAGQGTRAAPAPADPPRHHARRPVSPRPVFRKAWSRRPSAPRPARHPARSPHSSRRPRAGGSLGPDLSGRRSSSWPWEPRWPSPAIAVPGGPPPPPLDPTVRRARAPQTTPSPPAASIRRRWPAALETNASRQFRPSRPGEDRGRTTAVARRGRILDLEGRPIAGATVRVQIRPVATGRQARCLDRRGQAAG